MKQKVNDNCLNRLSAAVLLCCEVVRTVSERTVLMREEGMNCIYSLFNSSYFSVFIMHLALCFPETVILTCYSFACAFMKHENRSCFNCRRSQVEQTLEAEQVTPTMHRVQRYAVVNETC